MYLCITQYHVVEWRVNDVQMPAKGRPDRKLEDSLFIFPNHDIIWNTHIHTHIHTHRYIHTPIHKHTYTQSLICHLCCYLWLIHLLSVCECVCVWLTISLSFFFISLFSFSLFWSNIRKCTAFHLSQFNYFVSVKYLSPLMNLEVETEQIHALY